jgi:hypothetical protein
MDAADLLRHACNVMDGLQLGYLVTGSTATVAYGEPRFTNDIDIVVDLPPERLTGFSAAFPAPEYYINPTAVAEAVRSKHQFNVLHPASGLKIDFIVLTDSEFDQSRRRRGRSLPALPDRLVHFASPEDVILKKMTYYQEGGSEKHLRDIAGVLRVQGGAVDRTYIEQWATKLGVLDIWRAVQEAEAGS